MICALSDYDAGLIFSKLPDYLRLNIVKIDVGNEAFLGRLNYLIGVRSSHEPFQKMIASQLFIDLNEKILAYSAVV